MTRRLEGEADFAVFSLMPAQSALMSRPNLSPFLCALRNRARYRDQWWDRFGILSDTVPHVPKSCPHSAHRPI